jgi:hypothetical protein
VCDTRVRDDGSINARPFHTPILKPEVADWVALKYDEEKVDSRIDYDQCHGSIYDNPMNELDAYPKQEYSNRESDEDQSDRIHDLA